MELIKWLITIIFFSKKRMEISKGDLEKYSLSQKIKYYTHLGNKVKQNKYSYGRYINSGLSYVVYLFIADNEERLLKK